MPRRQGSETTAAPEPTAAQAAAASQAGVHSTPNPLKNAYFGEQHVHTAYSLDAYIGGARLTPDGAYRFAKGEEVDVGGQKLRLRRPLDWAAVTDHAEYIGEMYSTMTPGAPGHDSELLQQLRGLESAEEREKWFMQIVIGRRNVAKPQHPPFYAGVETEKAGWKDIVSAAERNYEPGRFTTIPAFEWSAGPKGANLHRNVFFRSTNVPDKVVSSFDIGREDGLWQWMDGLEKAGMQVLAIPHNSNASKGAMFAAVDPAGKPIDRAYAEMRSRFEPLVEMMQIKGNSEVHRAFWPNDEFADFENADSIQEFSERKFSRQNFVRDAIIQGLAWQQSLGVNPFHYGFVGGSDSHNGTPGNTAEDNFIAGGHGAADATVDRRRKGCDRWLDQGEGPEPGDAHRRVGRAEHARGNLGRAEEARDVRDQRHADPCAVLRRRGPFRQGRGPGGTGEERLCAWRADGRYASGVEQATDVHRACDEGSRRSQPRSHTDHQGLGGRWRRASREDRRRGLVGWPQAWRGRHSCRASAIPWTRRPPRTPIRSAVPNWSATGPTTSSIRSSTRSITRA